MTEETINIEEIMQMVRQQILEKRASQTADSDPVVNIQGKNLPAEFYEHLYHAGLTYDQIQPKLYVTESNIPIVGGFVQTIRQKLHELVLFYVNQVAANQIQVNHHLLKALNILAEEMEVMEESGQ